MVFIYGEGVGAHGVTKRERCFKWIYISGINDVLMLFIYEWR
jgi:hypothetical protein